MNENDLWLLVRAVREANFYVNTIVEKGEGAAAARLVKKRLLARAGQLYVYPTKSGFEFVGSMIDSLRRM